MKKIFIVLASIAVITACGGSKEEPNGGQGGGGSTTTPTITFGTGVNTNPVIGTEGGSVDISFTASDTWTAGVINTRADSWVSVSPSSGAKGSAKITITTKANDTPDERGATIQIKSGTTTKNIVLTQKQKDSFTASASKTEIGKEGGTFTIEVKANVSFTYTIDKGGEWIKYVSTKALKTSTITFEASENEDVDKREGQITVTSSAGKETFKIYQDGATPTIILTSNTVNVAQAGGTVQVEVKSNVDVSVAIQDGITWVSEVSSKAMSTNSWNFSVQENDSNDSRTADIYFTNKANNLSEKVQIVQAQKNAIVIANNYYEIAEAGGSFTVTVSHNVDFTVDISDSWITRPSNSTKAMVNDNITFNVSKNESGAERTGTVTFKSGDLQQVITVKQLYTVPGPSDTVPGFYGIEGLDWAFNQATDQIYFSNAGWGQGTAFNFALIIPATNKVALLSSGALGHEPQVGDSYYCTIKQNFSTTASSYMTGLQLVVTKVEDGFMWLKDDSGKTAIIKFK